MRGRSRTMVLGFPSGAVGTNFDVYRHYGLLSLMEGPATTSQYFSILRPERRVPELILTFQKKKKNLSLSLMCLSLMCRSLSEGGFFWDNGP